MSDVEDQVAKVILEALDVRREAIKPSSRFQEDLGADSLEVVELIMSAEDTFQIEIPDEKAETLRTVGDLIAFIKTGRHRAPPS